MKFVGIYGEDSPRKDEFFIRFTREEGRIVANAVDEHGETIDGGFLFNINKDGIFLYTSVASKFGFSLDSRGQLNIRTH